MTRHLVCRSAKRVDYFFRRLRLEGNVRRAPSQSQAIAAERSPLFLRTVRGPNRDDARQQERRVKRKTDAAWHGRAADCAWLPGPSATKPRGPASGRSGRALGSEFWSADPEHRTTPRAWCREPRIRSPPERSSFEPCPHGQDTKKLREVHLFFRAAGKQIFWLVGPGL